MAKINLYNCRKCGFETIIKDCVPRAVTPMFIACPKCKAQAISSCYTNPQNLTPNYEWFIPKSVQELKEACLPILGDVFTDKEYEKMLGSPMYREIKKEL